MVELVVMDKVLLYYKVLPLMDMEEILRQDLERLNFILMQMLRVLLVVYMEAAVVEEVHGMAEARQEELVQLAQ